MPVLAIEPAIRDGQFIADRAKVKSHERSGTSFELVESRNHAHQTPMGTIQRFQFSRFRRLKYANG
jgi:hypothetical protein